MSDNQVSYEEQKRQGLIQKRWDTFLPAKTGDVMPPLKPTQADTNAVITFEAQNSATSHIEVKTSFLDRAKGFTLITTQMSIVYSLAFVIVGRVAADIPIFSIWGALMFLIAYSVTLTINWLVTLQYSPEGVQVHEANRKYDILKMDVSRRWDAYEREQKQMLAERTQDRLEARQDRLEERQKRLGGK